MVSRKCIAPEYMPDNVLSVLAEPSDLKDAALDIILAHLYLLQQKAKDDSEPAFQFQQWIDKKGILREAEDRCLAPEPMEQDDEEPAEEAPKGKHKTAKKSMSRKGGKGKQQKSGKDKETSKETGEGIDVPPVPSKPVGKNKGKGKQTMSAKAKATPAARKKRTQEAEDEAESSGESSSEDEPTLDSDPGENEDEDEMSDMEDMTTVVVDPALLEDYGMMFDNPPDTQNGLSESNPATSQILPGQGIKKPDTTISTGDAGPSRQTQPVSHPQLHKFDPELQAILRRVLAGGQDATLPAEAQSQENEVVLPSRPPVGFMAFVPTPAVALPSKLGRKLTPGYTAPGTLQEATHVSQAILPPADLPPKHNIRPVPILPSPLRSSPLKETFAWMPSIPTIVDRPASPSPVICPPSTSTGNGLASTSRVSKRAAKVEEKGPKPRKKRKVEDAPAVEVLQPRIRQEKWRGALSMGGRQT